MLAQFDKFGRPRDFQKSIKKIKNRVRGAFGARLESLIEFGKVLGRFWEDFGRFLNGFGMDFWRFWDRLGFPRPTRPKIVKKGKTMIRTTK